jgi:hypothetical protein
MSAASRETLEAWGRLRASYAGGGIRQTLSQPFVINPATDAIMVIEAGTEMAVWGNVKGAYASTSTKIYTLVTFFARGQQVSIMSSGTVSVVKHSRAPQHSPPPRTITPFNR